MSIHDRPKRARKEAGYGTAAAAVRAFGFNANTYGANERGSAPYGREAVYTLTSHNAPPIIDVEIVEAARVCGTVEPSFS